MPRRLTEGLFLASNIPLFGPKNMTFFPEIFAKLWIKSAVIDRILLITYFQDAQYQPTMSALLSNIITSIKKWHLTFFTLRPVDLSTKWTSFRNAKVCEQSWHEWKRPLCVLPEELQCGAPSCGADGHYSGLLSPTPLLLSSRCRSNRCSQSVVMHAAARCWRLLWMLSQSWHV